MAPVLSNIATPTIPRQHAFILEWSSQIYTNFRTIGGNFSTKVSKVIWTTAKEILLKNGEVIKY